VRRGESKSAVQTNVSDSAYQSSKCVCTGKRAIRQRLHIMHSKHATDETSISSEHSLNIPFCALRSLPLRFRSTLSDSVA